jgi:hypothetical protein
MLNIHQSHNRAEQVHAYNENGDSCIELRKQKFITREREKETWKRRLAEFEPKNAEKEDSIKAR